MQVPSPGAPAVTSFLCPLIVWFASVQSLCLSLSVSQGQFSSRALQGGVFCIQGLWPAHRPYLPGSHWLWCDKPASLQRDSHQSMTVLPAGWQIHGEELGSGAQGNFAVLIKALLLFSRSFMSNSLQLHGLQQSRIPCPSRSPGVCSNLCPLSQ